MSEGELNLKDEVQRLNQRISELEQNLPSIPSEQALLTAMEQNWEHARHQENQRLNLFNIYAVLVAGIIYVVGLINEVWIRLLLIYFLAFLSVSIYLAFLKWNAEFSNHIAAIQSISRELRLLKEMEEADKELLRKNWKEAQKEEPKRIERLFFKIEDLFLKIAELFIKLVFKKEPKKKDIPEYAFFKDAYMALPLPLSIRAHEWTFTKFPMYIAVFTWSLAVVFTIHTITFSWLISGMVGIIMGLMVYSFCDRRLKKIEKERPVFIKSRKPKT